ncbi:MAG: hypothetical protein Q9180_009306, partial [Flavoplaca navasiana]
ILKDGLNTDLQLSKRLPLKYEEALENFMTLIFLAWRYAVRKMVHLVKTGPDFAEFTEKVDDPQGRRMDPRIRKSPKMPPILDLISSILEPKEAKMAGTLNILDKLSRMMETDPVPQSLISADLIREISKLAALAQIHDALVRHQPTIQITPQDPELMFRQHYDRLKVVDQLKEYLSLGSYIKPASAFTYPVGRKPTLEHTEQMRQAESKLDTFWDEVDKRKLQPKTGKTLVQWLGHRVTGRTLHRTEPWKPIIQSPAEFTPVQNAFQPFPESSPDDHGKLHVEPREKQKTRQIFSHY